MAAVKADGETGDEKGPMRPGGKAGQRPLQFGLGGLLGAAVAVAVVFGILRWLDIPTKVGVLILVVLVASLIAAVGLLVAIAASGDRPEGVWSEEEETDGGQP